MAANSRTLLPEPLTAALALRATHTAPPVDVAAMLSSIPFFRRRGAPGTTGSTSSSAAPRFGGLGGGGASRGGSGIGAGADSGRFGGFRPATSRPSEDGFEVYTGRRNNRSGGAGGGGGGGSRYHNSSHSSHYGGSSHHGSSHYGSSHHSTPSNRYEASGASASAAPVSAHEVSAATAPAAAAPATSVVVATPAAVEEPVARFSSAALRASVDTEDRKLARVKGKINKMGFGTYDATKVFMEQILSSDDTDFLDELMKYIFSKASTEPAYCPLYAKLIHELGDEYPRFREVAQTIFRDYVTTFAEVDAGTEPDPSSSDYVAFKESQERKRARRGYSQFVAELAKLGEVDVPAFAALIQQIVGVIETTCSNADKTLMGEEYIDCLANMCYSASGILSTADWGVDLKRRITALSVHTRKTAPGLSNKAIFALMDLNDFATRGWKQVA